MNLDRRSLFGVVAGTVAGACLPAPLIANAGEWKPVINDNLDGWIRPGTMLHLGRGETITTLRVDFSDPADVKFFMNAEDAQ